LRMSLLRALVRLEAGLGLARRRFPILVGEAVRAQAVRESCHPAHFAGLVARLGRLRGTLLLPARLGGWTTRRRRFALARELVVVVVAAYGERRGGREVEPGGSGVRHRAFRLRA